MAKSAQNGNCFPPEESNGLATQSCLSGGESSSTLKSSSESPGKTSCKDSDSGTCKPAEDDTEVESSLSDHRDDQSCEVADSKKSSSDTSRPSNEDDPGDVSATVPDDKKDDQTEAERATEQQSAKAEESDYNNFADNEDSCCSTVSKVQAVLENLRDIRTPKEVDIGEVINKRRRRKRSLGGKNSPSIRQRAASGAAPHPQGATSSSDSSQDAKVPEKVIGPTKFSSDLFKSASLAAGEGPSSAPVAQSSGSSLDRPSTSTSGESKDQKQSPQAGSSNQVVPKSVRRKIPSSLPSTSKAVPLPLSPLGSTPEDEEPSQYPSALLAENLHGNPHASRVNSLTSLLDQVVSVSDHMESIHLFADQYPPPRAATEEGPEPLGRVGHRNLRELNEGFRHCYDAFSSSEVNDEDEASASLIESIRHLKHQSSALCDRYCYSHDEERIPSSVGRLTREELRHYLPRIWDSLMTNNMILNQWTVTLLDWCLRTTPELYPQQFYDVEAGARNLYNDIHEVYTSIRNLFGRWNSRDMQDIELANLTYLHSLSTTALACYARLGEEINEIRYNLGNRRRRRDEETSDEGQGPSKKAKKE